MTNPQSVLSTHFGTVYPVPKGAVVDASDSAPLGKSVRFPVKGDAIVCAGVVGLLYSGGPSAVFAAVTKGVIHSINGVLRTRALPHIGQKAFKSQPLVAQRYSSVGVVLASVKVGVSGSGNHVCPDAERPRVGKPVGFASLGSCLGFEATARDGFAAAEVLPINNSLIPASTNANPLGLSVGIALRFGDRLPASESLTSKVNEFCHSALLNVAHLMVHGRNRCGFRSGATLAMRGVF